MGVVRRNEPGCAIPPDDRMLGPEQWARHLLERQPIFVPLPDPPDAEAIERARRILKGEFTAVGESFVLGAGYSWKNNPSRDKEWLIAHHKLYAALDLAQAFGATREIRFALCWGNLIGSWLDEMGTGYITASDAQVEAKRVEHLVVSLAILIAADGIHHVPEPVLTALVGRLAYEADYILEHLRPARNHRTFQLYAVFLVGVFLPEFAQAEAWRTQAKVLLTANLLSDFSSDGVHIELSSHYHQITLETALAFVEAASNNGVTIDEELLARLRSALDFSLWITLPDGEIPLIGDADNGDHRALLAHGADLFNDPKLQWVASSGGSGCPPEALSRAFEDSGYMVMRNAWGSDEASYRNCQHVFYDCAKLGEGSHAHYDLFNLCYAIGGRQLIVDPGRYTYDAEPDQNGIDWRYEFKRTAAHNTVVIDRLDQTRYLSKARTPASGLEKLDRKRHVGKHGPAVQIIAREQALGHSSDWILATAQSAEYAPLHTRLLVYMERGYLFVLDHLQCADSGTHHAELNWHLAASCLGAFSATHEQDNYVARGTGWQIRLMAPSSAEVSQALGWVSKTYGIKEEAPTISATSNWRHQAAFATVIAPDHSEFRVEALTGKTGADGVGSFLVTGQRSGVAWQDSFALASDGQVRVENEHFRYAGRFSAWRCEAGRLTHVLAASPEELALPSDDMPQTIAGGHIEWSARRAA